MDEREKRDTVERALDVGRTIQGESRDLTESERLDRAFTYHQPEGQQEANYAAIRAAGKNLAIVILNSTPRCADRTDAIRKVREACMTANAAVALHGLI